MDVVVVDASRQRGRRSKRLASDQRAGLEDRRLKARRMLQEDHDGTRAVFPGPA
jgi:hypothetical protein